MVNPLSQLENLAERLVEGTFARILGARLQPIEVARHIARAMEDGQVINAQGEIVVPNEYLVTLHPDDLGALESYQDTLRDELRQYVVNLARRAGATMVGRPRVFVQANPAVSPRRVRVEGRLVSARLGSIDLTRTQEMQMPGPPAVQEAAPAFVLFDGYRHMPVAEAMITIGRSLDNDIILDDRRVSRQHAQLRRQYGQYVLYDLDSTGGVTVNGRPVRECVLQAGDVIAFAGVQVRFERADVVDDALSSSNVTRVLPPSSRLRRQGQGTSE
jgi:hypothetical protein